MVYPGYVRIGGVEVINTERARGYLESTDCPERWIVSDPEDGVRDAAGDTPYTYSNITDAPWYDTSLSGLSSRFFGIVGVRLDNVKDSTRSASRTEGVTDGGVIGRTRKGMKDVRVRATLIARGDDALDYGVDWLNAVFDGGCSQHGAACQTTDAEFFSECPPPRGILDPADYVVLADAQRRYLHDISVTSGPFIVSESVSNSGSFRRRTLEWTITSERAWTYGKMRDLTLTPALPTIVQDAPYNLMPYPSAELAAGNVVVATNLSTNPGVEVDATGWVGVGSVPDTGGGTDPSALLTSGRSTDIGAGGSSASFRVRLLSSATVSNARGQINAYQEVAIPAATGRRVSMNMWEACLILSGTAAVVSITFSYEFFNGATSLGKTKFAETTTPAAFQGQVGTLSAVAVPATATKVRMTASAIVTYSSTAATPADIRLYADAVTVSVP